LKDLYIKLVRGSDTIIELKEIGISLEPGVNPNSFYTNIEGLLSRFNMSVNSMIRYYGILKSEEKDKSELVKINDALNRLDVLKQKMHNYIEGLEQFTIILDAKKGHGAILSSKAEDITKKTIKKKEPKNKKLVPKKKKTIKRNKK
jgi:C4-type Zn-finger protein